MRRLHHFHLCSDSRAVPGSGLPRTADWIGGAGIIKDGKPTRWHRWYHNVFLVKCLIWGHDTYCGWYNDTQEGFDHCRRCERYNNSHQLPSFHLWARLVYLQIKVEQKIVKLATEVK